MKFMHQASIEAEQNTNSGTTHIISHSFVEERKTSVFLLKLRLVNDTCRFDECHDLSCFTCDNSQ